MITKPLYKRHFPMFRRQALWLAAIISLGAFSLSVEAQKNKQPPGTPLCATLFNDGGSALQNATDSPGDGESATYCGSAQFDSYGRLGFNGVAFIDATACFNGCAAPLPEPGNYDINLQTRAANCFDGPLMDLRNLQEGGEVYLGIVLRILVPLDSPDPNDPGWKTWTEWFVVFGDWPNDEDCSALHVKYPCSNGAPAIVRKEGGKWILEAPPGEVCLLEHAPTRKNDPDPFKLRGRISFPFRIEFMLP